MVGQGRSIMLTTGLERDGLRYIPRDGYVYGWRKGDEWITVYRVLTDRSGTQCEVKTNDVIAVPAVRTGEALAVAVDQWRERTR